MLTRFTHWRKIHRPAAIFLALLLSALFVAAIFFIQQYPVSYDEFLLYDFAQLNAQAYKKFIFGLNYEHLLEYYDLRYYGPAYLVIGNIFARFFLRVLPGYDLYDAWHLVNFGLFLIGAWMVFLLGRRFTAGRFAVWGVLLFLTQPLLWGHGIMNPKDSAFVVFFLAAVLLGLSMVDRANQPQTPAAWEQRLQYARAWLSAHLPRWLSAAALLLSAAALIDRLGDGLISRPILTAGLTRLAAAPQSSLSQRLLASLADRQAQIDFSLYLNKALEIVQAVEFWWLFAILALGLLAALSGTERATRAAFGAGVALGLASAVRIIGPAAVGIVAVYAWQQKMKRPLPLFGVYLAAGMLAMLLIWPYLWLAPISRFLECLQVMAAFPWQGSVRFEGMDILADSLPWTYLPKLLGLQLTLPTLLLAALGLLHARKNHAGSAVWLASAAWFFLPLTAVMLVRPNMYDNFRQFLFILPPLFAWAGFGLERLTQRMGAWPRSAVMVGLLIPGIAAGVYLHPYEYVYYNVLAGWTGNIERRYETDYWGTAVCEAGQYLDEHAEAGALIGLTDGILKQIFDTCTTPGKFDVRLFQTEGTDWTPEYAVVLSRYDDDLDYFRNLPVLKTIGRGQTNFAVIRGAP